MPILQQPQHRSIAQAVVLPILAHWAHCRRKVLREILLVALQVADQPAFLRVAETALTRWNPHEPARYALWLGAAFLLDPAQHAATLSDYLGRSRERILPLLDFIVLALQADTQARYALSAASLAVLLRAIAPKFTPQEDRYGNLCDNTLRVMYLFYRLASSTDPERDDVVSQLAKVRVMKLYAAILDAIQTMPAGGEAGGFDAFVHSMQRAGNIHVKRNWSDLK